MRLLQVRLLLLLLLRWAGDSVPAVAAHAAGEMRSLAEAGRSSRAEFGGGIGCECIEVGPHVAAQSSSRDYCPPAAADIREMPSSQTARRRERAGGPPSAHHQVS